MKPFNPWDKRNKPNANRQSIPAKYGVGKFGGARVGSRRPGARGK